MYFPEDWEILATIIGGDLSLGQGNLPAIVSRVTMASRVTPCKSFGLIEPGRSVEGSHMVSNDEVVIFWFCVGR